MRLQVESRCDVISLVRRKCNLL